VIVSWGVLQKKMSESYLCVDCGFDTQPGAMNRAEAEQAIDAQIAAGTRDWSLPTKIDSRAETFTVHDHVWNETGMEPWGGVLCVGCLEQRIGRRLTPDDFPDRALNNLPGTDRLLERQGRRRALGDWEEVA
jgi:hypothetical protein